MVFQFGYYELLILLTFFYLAIVLRNDVDPTAALARVTEKRWIRIEAELEHLASRVANILAQKGIKPETVPSAPAQTLKKAPLRDLVIW